MSTVNTHQPPSRSVGPSRIPVGIIAAILGSLLWISSARFRDAVCTGVNTLSLGAIIGVLGMLLSTAMACQRAGSVIASAWRWLGRTFSIPDREVEDQDFS